MSSSASLGRDKASGARGLYSEPAILAVGAFESGYDDVHWPSLTHPGGLVWPILLTLGHQEDLTVFDLFDSATIGYDVIALVGTHLPKADMVWHPTTVAGPIGAAAAGAFLLSRDADCSARAAQLASSVVGGVMAPVLIGKGDDASFHREHAVLTAAAAIRSAVKGQGGMERVLEMDGGILQSMGGNHVNSVCQDKAQGSIELATLRLYGGAAFAQGALEAAKQIREGTEDRIAGVEVLISPLADLLSRGLARRRSSWNVGELVSATLSGWDPHSMSADACSTEEARRLNGVTTVSVDGDLSDDQARIILKLRDGTVIETAVVRPLSYPGKDVGRQELIAKACRLMEGVSANRLDELFARTDRLETVRSLFQYARDVCQV